MSKAVHDRDGRKVAAVLGLLALVQFVTTVDYNIVYVALPPIGASVGLSGQGLQWVVSAYALAFGAALLSGGRACDLVGPRPLLLWGLGVFAVASIAGGLAQEPVLLLAARAGQGLGGALMFPASLTLIGVLFPEERARRRAFAVWGTAGGSGLVSGSLLGGVLTAGFGWPAVFFVNVPLALVALGLAVAVVPRDAPRARRRLDLPGAFTAAVGVVLVVLGLTRASEDGWVAPSAWGSLLGGLVALVVFLAIEHRSRDPLVPLGLLRDRDLATGATITFLYMGVFSALLYFLTLYFQVVRGFDPFTTGLAFVVPMVAMIASTQGGAVLATRYGPRFAMITCLVATGIGTLLIVAGMSGDGTYLALVPGLVILGLGHGTVYTVMYDAAVRGVGPEDRGVASGLASTTQQIGVAVGLAVLVAVAAIRPGTLDGIRLALLAGAGGITAAAVIALGYAPRRRSTALS